MSGFGWPRTWRGSLVLLAALALAGIAGACGSAPSLPPADPPPAGGLPRADGGLPPAPEGALPGPSGLPGLDKLPAPSRSLSATTYGFQPLVPSDTVATAATSANPDDSLTFSPGAGAPSYALYGLSGFRDGAYPVSAKLTFTNAVSDCFVAFPDYHNGRWRLEGPFTASVEAPIVLRGQPQGYANFISPSGDGYFAVLFPAGNPGGTLSALSFGVNGGDSGPDAPRILNAQGGDKGIVVEWEGSDDEQAADFAGYLLERAPQFDGEFTPLTADLIVWHDHFDSTTEPATTYRYRLSALDVSGNRSSASIFTAWETAGALLDPVARVRFTPDGPYQAPAIVQYDMSESYDPEGEVLFGHAIQQLINGQTLATGEAGSFELQPGAYFLGAVVEAGTRSSSTMNWLKAYPQWETSSGVVRAPDTSTSVLFRLVLASPFRLPGDSAPWVVGYDIAASGVAFMRNELGGLVYHRAPLTNFAMGLSRPLIAGNACWIAATDLNFQLSLIRFNGSGAQVVDLINAGDNPTVAALAATTGDTVRYFYTTSVNGTDYSLATGTTAIPDGSTDIFATGAKDDSQLKALYNPAADRYDIFYVTDTNQTRWIRWNAATNTIESNQILKAAAADAISPALSPADGLTTVAYAVGGDWFWRSYNGAWSAEETVNGTPADAPGELAFQDDQAFLLASKATGQTTLYHRTGPATWVERNTPIPATDGGRSCGLIPGDNPGELYGTDGIVAGGVSQTRLFMFDSAGNDTTLLNQPSTNWACADYCAVGGSDGLHLVARTNFIGGLEHWRSADGVTWTGAPLALNMTNTDLGANSLGEVYLGGYSGGTNDGRIYWWDNAGSAFMPEATSIVASNTSSVSLRASFLNPSIELCGYDSTGPKLNAVSGQHGGAWTTSSQAAPSELWRGRKGLSGWCGSAGGTAEPGGSFIRLLSGTATELFDPLAESQFQFSSQLMLNNYSYQNALAFMRSDSVLGSITQKDYFVAGFGKLIHPARLEVDVFTGPSLSELPFGDITLENFLTTGECRRTVSMATTRSGNALSLISALDGSIARFEWTGDSGWEDLALPAGIPRLMAPQVVAGYDGRWHIIYYDWVTDEVLIRSTL